ncbi:hypothetical protein AAIR98_000008 [Elusimicrobium simillimum]|uniref:hypothetical protein n=1 Tax=Elusimicrobium simillimum TaxID=3143438 RepID=UPI003C6F0529
MFVPSLTNVGTVKAGAGLNTLAAYNDDIELIFMTYGNSKYLSMALFKTGPYKGSGFGYSHIDHQNVCVNGSGTIV